MAGSTECSSDSNILQRTLASKSITDACNKHNRTGLLNVQCKAKVKKGDEAAIAKWGGVGKHKVDKMEYSIWELEHLYSQIREKEAETHGLVRSNSTLHYSDGLRGSDLRLLLRCWVRFVQLQLCMHDGYGSLCGVCTLHVTLAWRSMVPDSVWVQAYSGQVQCMQETSAAFVTTRTRLTQSVATTGLMSFNEDLWTTKVAPAPNDVIWSNLALRGWERSIRNVISWVLFVVLIIMFFPIVALLQQIINLQSYAKDGNWAQTILNLPVAGRAPLLLHRLDPRPALLVFACASQRAASVCTMPESCVQCVYAYQLSDERKTVKRRPTMCRSTTQIIAAELIKGVLPTLALTICLLLVPVILKLIATKVERLPAQSAVDFDLGKKFFFFMFFIVFLANTILGGLSTAQAVCCRALWFRVIQTCIARAVQRLTTVWRVRCNNALTTRAEPYCHVQQWLHA